MYTVIDFSEDSDSEDEEETEIMEAHASKLFNHLDPVQYIQPGDYVQST